MDEQDLTQEFVEAAEAIGALAGDEERFRAVVDAFRAVDADSFQRLLRESEVLERCELVCRWLCSKECVLLCLELVGPPGDEEPPDALDFAQVVARITGDEELVERLATAITEREADKFQALISDLQLERFRHLLCHWACFVHCRLICQVICSPTPVPRADYVEELTLAGAAIGKLAEDKTAFSQAAEAALALDCDRLRGVLAGVSLAERCEVICEWFCSLRCIRVCFILCRRFPIDAAAAPLSEAFEFARASAQLAATPDSFKRVLDALQAEDVDAFGTVIDELQLGRFCVQLCHWLCYLHCFRYCRCVCRPILVPWFTHVGHFDIYADIDSSTGLTNKGLSYSGLYFHGGPGFGFHSCLELRGFCPTTSPNVPGVPMRYRFLYELVAGSPIPITGSLVCDVDAGTRLINWPQNVGGIAGAALVPTFQTIKVAGAPVPDPVPPAPGSPWQGPAEHVITPDAQGWIAVDPNAIGGGFQTLIGFATTQAVAGGDPAPGVPAGSAVPGPNQKNGTDLAIIFEATRLPGPTSPPDFTNSLAKIHLNNWTEVNLLDILQFHTGGGNACSPITTDLDVEFTADHELMAAWALSITSASPSAPGTVASGNAPRGGFGTHHENTTTWQPCSYVVTLSTRAALTDGLIDNQGFSQQKTFCISGGGRPVG